VQGAGIVIPILPSGGSSIFQLTATVTATSGSLTNTATVSPAPGNIDPVPGNNSASDTDFVSYKLWLPVILKQPTALGQWQLMLGYEDLPLATGRNDYDYNDWIVQISSTVSYLAESPGLMQKINLSFVPQASGAAYDHSFGLRFPAQVFASNGTAVLTIYDRNHNVLNTHTQPFIGSVDNQFEIFPDTMTVFPGALINTIEGLPVTPPQRFADLSLTFDTPFVFSVTADSLSQPHGQGLFFDPTMLVLNTGETIHSGDVRLLTVPINNWLWPEEGIRLDRAYPQVVYAPGNPPSFTFPAMWWTTHNHCVYDGVACGTP
jgi:hypothetical protein